MGKQFKQKKVKAEQIKLEEGVELKQEVKSLPQKVKESDKNKEKNKGKRNRLIIRNLVFDINEKHIKKLLAPYGEIAEVEVPKNPNNEKCNRGFAFVEFVNYRSCQKAIKQLNQSTFKGRTIVIDFSVAKVRYMTEKLDQGEQNKMDQPQKIENQNDEQQIKEQPQPDKKKKKKETKAEQPEKPENPVRQPQDLTRTIFIRNVPASASEEDLNKLFSRFGKVKWARVVVDKNTGAPRGTAFVKYMDSAIAHKIIEYSRSYEMFLQGKLIHFRSDPLINLEIQGTIMKVFPVETKQNIDDKLRERQRQEIQLKKPTKLKPLKKIKKLKDLIMYDKQGKRRIVLAQLGLWQPNDEMSEQDQQRFKIHSKEKIQKLKNPNNIVSDKRVILKYLDKNIQQQRIKEIARQFLAYNNLSGKELTYCKLMLDAQRKKSAGYAFLEFANSKTSQAFVTQLAENQQILMDRPFVVEFAVQDSRKMQKILHKRK